MNYAIRNVLRFGLMLALLCSVIVISGCPVTLVSKYDEQTDANVTALQKKLDTYFLKLNGASYPDCSFAANKSFYDEVNVQLSSTQIRANAIPKNEITIQQLDILSKAIVDLEQAQKLRDGKGSCLPTEIVTADRIMFNSIFTAILKFELAKKRGESN
ncbi:MAG: hypothetical protein A2076_04650 [Geobacteraceae bacterium GWC2_53_11]|nr:MAG: hypothetical protein A2076_04650 [Geobacteraceae bacterium GWC2_53_11]